MAIKLYIPLVITLALCACSTTKRLTDDEKLYTGVRKIEIASTDGQKVGGSVESAVKSPLSVKPNNPLFSPYVRTPFPLGLWAWNYLYTTRKSGLKAWLYRNLAKEPVLISQVKPDLRTGLVKDILDNYGYFGSKATYEIIPQRNPRKARLSYSVEVAPPWTYSRVEYPEPKSSVTRAIDTMKHTSELLPGRQFNIDTLTRERNRITATLREQSYYYFRPEYIEYLADTTRERYKVDLRMTLAQGIPPAALQPYDIGKISVYLFSSEGGGEPDSTDYKGIRIWYQKPLKIRPKVLDRALTIEPGEAARVSTINTTLTNLSQLGIFRYVNMEVSSLDSLKAGQPMDMKITAAFDQPLQADLEANFSYKSSSFLGPGAVFSIKNKNIFKGGEVLAVRANGSYEWQTGNTKAGSAVAMNSYELGLTTSLTFPRLVAPGFIPRNKYGARTTYNIGAVMMNRPRYFTIASFNIGTSYDFQTSPGSFHNLTLFKFTYNKTLNATPKFDTILQQHPSLARSFENQFVPSASYTYIWNQPTGRDKQNLIVWSTTGTTAGNIFAAVRAISGGKKPGKIFGNVYSQFVKVTTELKYYHKIGEKNTLAMRFFAGAAKPYGNIDVIPYIEQFYIGGANSIRAYTIRSIGPGSYHPTTTVNGYFDQTGDMKLEANIEFRFGIAGDLKGAVFFDAGNIWLLRKNPEYPGGEFTFKNFFDDVATGTGFGLRYDLTFLVLRADLGIGIHLPYDTGKSGYYNIPKFRDGLGLHVAIGYPF